MALSDKAIQMHPAGVCTLQRIAVCMLSSMRHFSLLETSRARKKSEEVFQLLGFVRAGDRERRNTFGGAVTGVESPFFRLGGISAFARSRPNLQMHRHMASPLGTDLLHVKHFVQWQPLQPTLHHHRPLSPQDRSLRPASATGATATTADSSGINLKLHGPMWTCPAHGGAWLAA